MQAGGFCGVTHEDSRISPVSVCFSMSFTHWYPGGHISYCNYFKAIEAQASVPVARFRPGCRAARYRRRRTGGRAQDMEITPTVVAYSLCWLSGNVSIEFWSHGLRVHWSKHRFSRFGSLPLASPIRQCATASRGIIKAARTG